MNPLAVFVTVLVFTLLTVGYVKGKRFVTEHSPDNLIKFHFIMVAVRFIFAITAVGIFALLSPSREDTVHFAALVLGLYLTMIVVTIIFKH
ncbi:MAG: hypothetical protein J6Y97_01135 [Prevotella sp.]|nr:hypothetical protein [Prevotella sp.]MBP5508974.1 hypothetical protein [Prevotella sp.]